ncbi:DNA helicase RecQ [Pseudemcibacter aquimaris]|uniref:DNA helicase RecQ n=1 Tax=Pseudemcibacter aquimaris TaxID=2857064 RepID=UPI0020121565|nr:DNA helicase RecQ [Pseudemcibacter aquimaris]MCC3862501.1 DNA helicase RecQ [Pseudemcibacter aquimaris]WDU57763.1 DNA helicase RecQ [Pseudemcibacter aquimaris]
MNNSSAEEVLKDVFGFDAFRGKQKQIIEHIISGENVLAVMPTGAGKSLCFQLPGLMMDGLTIVVSPLISLMQNQVEALKIAGVAAETINSNTGPDEGREIWRKINDGTLKFLYVSPEKLMTEQMLDRVDELNVSLFAIDEAHCISQWGAAFRPEYEDLALLHRRYPNIPIIALTATADKGTREQICEKIFSDNVKTYLTGFDRPNIALNVEIKAGWKKQLLKFMKDRPGNENGIVYCLSRKKTEEATAILMESGYNALPYHAGMTGNDRERNLNKFMTEPDLIMVATIAFGMGIDKPDIRFVFHTDLPSSPEAYYQEIGRAGRDGDASIAHMLYGLDDIRMRRMFIDNEQSDDGHKRRGHQRLNALLSYAEAPECRRVTLLRYFGDDPEYEKCGNCDLCQNPRETVDAVEAGQKFISAIYRTGQSFGVAHIVNIVTGKMTDKISQLNHDMLPTFGVGKEYSINEWKVIARQLMARGFIVSDMEYGSLKITDEGFDLLRGNGEFRYRPDVSYKKSATSSNKKSAQVVQELPSEDQDLYLKLKSLRKEIAAERSVPAYIIFSDKSLIDMAVQKPTSYDDFGGVYGVGAEKQKKFAKQFTEFIAENLV